MVEFHSLAINRSLTPVTRVGNESVVKRALCAQFKTCFRTHARFVSAAKTVLAKVMGTHQREHHRAVVCHEIARQPAIEQSNTVLPVTVVHPVLCRKFNADLALDSAERNSA